MPPTDHRPCTCQARRRACAGASGQVCSTRCCGGVCSHPNALVCAARPRHEHVPSCSQQQGLGSRYASHGQRLVNEKERTRARHADDQVQEPRGLDASRCAANGACGACVSEGQRRPLGHGVCHQGSRGVRCRMRKAERGSCKPRICCCRDQAHHRHHRRLQPRTSRLRKQLDSFESTASSGSTCQPRCWTAPKFGRRC